MAKAALDWYDKKSHVYLNHLMPEAKKALLMSAIAPYHNLDRHVWLASSGTENFPKMIALSKEAMLTAAQAVNEHFEIKKTDKWLNILPLFHTGGLAIHARALLSESTVYDFSENKWDPIQYVKNLEELEIAFSSLTPTHVYDIVSRNLYPPKNVKAIIVGGGRLAQNLHEKAFSLGWPFQKSYGMTEACSQIATASSSNPKAELVLLKHIDLRFNTENFIEIKSKALLTGFVHGDDPDKVFIDPQVKGWYTTQDKGALSSGCLQIFGRGANFIKIGGENISFSELENMWESIKIKYQYKMDAVLIDLPDQRLGNIITLATLSPRGEVDFANLTPLIEEFHRQVLPIAKIRDVYSVEAIPRTELFKLKKKELRELILGGV